jgi:hypothetical protein
MTNKMINLPKKQIEKIMPLMKVAIEELKEERKEQ